MFIIEKRIFKVILYLYYFTLSWLLLFSKNYDLLDLIFLLNGLIFFIYMTWKICEDITNYIDSYIKGRKGKNESEKER